MLVDLRIGVEFANALFPTTKQRNFRTSELRSLGIKRMFLLQEEYFILVTLLYQMPTRFSRGSIKEQRMTMIRIGEPKNACLQAAGLLKGKSVVIFVGGHRPHHKYALQDALQLKELAWVNTSKKPSYRSFEKTDFSSRNRFGTFPESMGRTRLQEDAAILRPVQQAPCSASWRTKSQSGSGANRFTM